MGKSGSQFAKPDTSRIQETKVIASMPPDCCLGALEMLQ